MCLTTIRNLRLSTRGLLEIRPQHDLGIPTFFLFFLMKSKSVFYESNVWHGIDQLNAQYIGIFSTASGLVGSMSLYEMDIFHFSWSVVLGVDMLPLNLIMASSGSFGSSHSICDNCLATNCCSFIKVYSGMLQRIDFNAFEFNVASILHSIRHFQLSCVTFSVQGIFIGTTKNHLWDGQTATG